MSEVERISIDNDLAFHGAPTLLGVKCANLISFDKDEDIMAEYIHEITEKLAENGLSALQLCKCRKRTLVYIYNEKMLSAWLGLSQVSGFLSEYGYTADMSVEVVSSLNSILFSGYSDNVLKIDLLLILSK